ncbi:GNAT family N-acetyltransferase [Mycobacterium heidelbergense]|uniref:GNAT family N-acetyltransferase n=1 Tax=Mycobacterium heidelbergense TaxID=53376 RepID=UPI003CF62905
MTDVLELQRLTLRPVSADDADFLIAHWSDPMIRRFLFDATPAVPDEIVATIMESVRGFASAGYGLWVIRLEANCPPVGAVGLRPLEDLGLEVFYSLTPDNWGNGYATEAAGGVIAYALGELGLAEVFAEVDGGNVASAAVIERLGMTSIACIRGALGPVTRYRMTRNEGCAQ